MRAILPSGSPERQRRQGLQPEPEGATPRAMEDEMAAKPAALRVANAEQAAEANLVDLPEIAIPGPIARLQRHVAAPYDGGDAPPVAACARGGERHRHADRLQLLA